MSWIVLCYDCRQGEHFVIGPFSAAPDAYKWALADAESKAEQWDMKSGLDAYPDESNTILDENQENVYEWSVMQLAAPN